MTDPDNDPYHLQRFIDAQSSCFDQVRAELAAGRKRSHWMWFIFPQIRGLGSSPTAQHFAISGLEEAAAYLAHPILGPRLCECTALVNAVNDRNINQIFGYPDNLKFHSSVTLFAQAAAQGSADDTWARKVFAQALENYFDGAPDRATQAITQAIVDRLQH